MLKRLIEVVGIACACLLASSQACMARSIMIDDVLRMEIVGRAEFIGGDRFLVYEKIEAYEEAPNSSAVYQTNLLGPMSKLFVFDRQGAREPQPLFAQDPAGGYWIAAVSPDANRVAIYSLVGDEFRTGVFDVRTGVLIWFDFTPNYFWQIDRPVWISNEELVYAALAPGDRPSGLFRSSIAARQNELWARAFAGREPSATVFRSSSTGLAEAQTYRAGGLIRVNAASGASRVIDQGYFYGFSLSPNGRYLATLRRGGLIQPTPGRVWIGAHHQLVLHDLANSQRRIVCERCSLSESGFVHWSADSERLVFYARRLDADIEQVEFYQYWPHNRALRRAPASPLMTACGLTPIPVGPGEGVAVYSQPLTGRERPGSDGACPLSGERFDWRIVSDHRVQTLSAQFANPTAESRFLLGLTAPLGVSREAIFIIADGEVWRLGIDGDRRRLTNDLRGGAADWSPGAQDASSSTPARRIVLQTRDAIRTINITTEEVEGIERPAQGARLAALGTAGSVAAFLEPQGNASRLVMSAQDGAPRSVEDLNPGLNAVTTLETTMVRYEHHGASLSSCALLPPTWRPDRRYPTIVYLYPGGSTESRCPDDQLSEFNPSNMQLLAAEGYVVLFAANPRSLTRTQQGPLRDMAAVVLAGVDAAIDQGLTDPERIGIFGWSQGFHTVLETLTQTDRFDAAVIMNGASDAFSHYGAIPYMNRMSPEIYNFGNTDRYELATGPQGLGVQPWEDPFRYFANSPALNANRITTPLLIFHADLDSFPLGQSEELFSSLFRLRREAVYVTYWGEAHGLMSPANLRDFWRRVHEWYDDRLGSVQERRNDRNR